MTVVVTMDSLIDLQLAQVPETLDTDQYELLQDIHNALAILVGEVDNAAGTAIETITAAAYTAEARVDNTLLMDTNANAVTITLPTAVGIKGVKFTFKCVDATNAATIDGDGTETIDGALTKVLALNALVIVQSDGTNWQIVGN